MALHLGASIGVPLIGFLGLAIFERKRIASHAAQGTQATVTPPVPIPPPVITPTPSPIVAPVPNPFLNDPNVGNPNEPATGQTPGGIAPDNAGAFTDADLANMGAGQGPISEEEQGPYAGHQGVTGWANPFRRSNPFRRAA